MSHICEHLQHAALVLTGCGPLKDRLATAYRAHLARVEIADVPFELQQDFAQLRQAFTHERPLFRGEDAVLATLRKMSNREAHALAERVTLLFCTSCSAQFRARNGAISTASPVVQLFATEH